MPYIAVFGLALNLLASGIYLRDMLRGKAKPNRITSGFWALEGGIAVVASFAAGATWAVVPVLAAFLGPLSALTLSFFLPQAKWSLTLFDWGCGASAILALIAWAITKDPNMAIGFAILGDCLAAIPTVIKSWKYPETESGIAFALPVPAYMTSFLVLQDYSFAEIAFPLSSILICALITAFIYTGPMRKKRRGSERGVRGRSH